MPPRARGEGAEALLRAPWAGVNPPPGRETPSGLFSRGAEIAAETNLAATPRWMR
jgi:hypothetical protein